MQILKSVKTAVIGLLIFQLEHKYIYLRSSGGMLIDSVQATVIMLVIYELH